MNVITSLPTHLHVLLLTAALVGCSGQEPENLSKPSPSPSSEKKAGLEKPAPPPEVVEEQGPLTKADAEAKLGTVRELMKDWKTCKSARDELDAVLVAFPENEEAKQLDSELGKKVLDETKRVISGFLKEGKQVEAAYILWKIKEMFPQQKERLEEQQKKHRKGFDKALFDFVKKAHPMIPTDEAGVPKICVDPADNVEMLQAIGPDFHERAWVDAMIHRCKKAVEKEKARADEDEKIKAKAAKLVPTIKALIADVDDGDEIAEDEAKELAMLLNKNAVGFYDLQLDGAFPTSSYAKAMKDIDAERGKVIVTHGSVVEIVKQGEVYLGQLRSSLGDDYFFVTYDPLAAKTIGVVRGAQKEFAGIVLQRYSFENKIGGRTPSVLLVGEFR
jgi:hypothetical protein